jgi:hypothetical protein
LTVVGPVRNDSGDIEGQNLRKDTVSLSQSLSYKYCKNHPQNVKRPLKKTM